MLVPGLPELPELRRQHLLVLEYGAEHRVPVMLYYFPVGGKVQVVYVAAYCPCPPRVPFLCPAHPVPHALGNVLGPPVFRVGPKFGGQDAAQLPLKTSQLAVDDSALSHAVSRTVAWYKRFFAREWPL